MILGTASHVGKSIITAGLGRIFADEGFHIAPLQGPEHVAHSAATPDGGRLAVLRHFRQRPVRVPPSVEMNPSTPQAVFRCELPGSIARQGVGAGERCRLPYWSSGRAIPVVLQSYQKLASHYDIIFVEGAGSPRKSTYVTTISLTSAWHTHRMLRACSWETIDRGGVFASLLGTMELLEPADEIVQRIRH